MVIVLRRIEVHLLERHTSRDVELRAVGVEVGLPIGVARLDAERIAAQNRRLLQHSVPDDGIVSIETQGDAVTVEHLVANIALDEPPELCVIGRAAVVHAAELSAERSDAIRRHHDLGLARGGRRERTVRHEDRGAEPDEVGERFAKDARDHGVYQMGEVKARSCVVMGTFGSIVTLK
jgi:hypothetical protein